MSLTDFLVVTPLDEEWRAVRRILGPKQIEKPINTVTYYLSIYGWPDKPEDGDYLIAASSMGKMGLAAAGIFATTAINLWRPEQVILLGIAGSCERKKLQLGDVIVSEEIFGYEVGEAGGRPPKFDFRKTGHQAGALLLDRVRAIRNDQVSYSRWQKACLKAAAKEPLLGGLTRPPEINFGITASGNYVVKSTAFVKELQRQIDQRIVAVEMEAKGLFDAVRHAESRTAGLMVRGISDYANSSKNRLDRQSKNAWRHFAAGNTARLVSELWHRHPTIPISPACSLNIGIDSYPDLNYKEGIALKETDQQNLSFSNLIDRTEPIPAFDLEVQGLRRLNTYVPPDRALCILRAKNSTQRFEPRIHKNAATFSLPQCEEPSRIQLALGFEKPVKLVEIRYKDEFGRNVQARWGKE